MRAILGEELQRFALWALDTFRTDGRFDAVRVVESEPGSRVNLTVHLEVGAKSRYEIRLVVGRLELHVGFSTEDSSVNETIERALLESGDTLTELLEAELDDIGEEPVEMEHFFDRPTFRYLARLELDSLEELNAPETYARVRAVLEACHEVFQEWTDAA